MRAGGIENQPADSASQDVEHRVYGFGVRATADAGSHFA